MNSTGFPINKAIKHTVFVHPRSASAMLTIFQYALIRAEFTLYGLHHGYIIKLLPIKSMLTYGISSINSSPLQGGDWRGSGE